MRFAAVFLVVLLASPAYGQSAIVIHPATIQAAVRRLQSQASAPRDMLKGQTRDSLWTGALIGAVVGAVAGSQSCWRGTKRGCVFKGAIAFAGVGAWIDSMF